MSVRHQASSRSNQPLCPLHLKRAASNASKTIRMRMFSTRLSSRQRGSSPSFVLLNLGERRGTDTQEMATGQANNETPQAESQVDFRSIGKPQPLDQIQHPCDEERKNTKPQSSAEEPPQSLAQAVLHDSSLRAVVCVCRHQTSSQISANRRHITGSPP